MSAFSYSVEEADFEILVVERSHTVPVLLDISADWCSPCRILAPMLERLVHQYKGQFVLATVDADENMRIAGRHQAKGFPTVIAYRDGNIIDRFHGTKPEHFLRTFIDNVINHRTHTGT